MASRTTTRNDVLSVYADIGEDLIREAITAFYAKAFDDIIIGHLFMHADRLDLIKHQCDFAISMLGGPKRYQGKPLAAAHFNLKLKPAHFGRRQVLMRETLASLPIDPAHCQRWLEMEQALRPLVLHSQTSCLGT